MNAVEDGLIKATEEGTPQGGPLSPLLSNIMLDDFDKELEKRGLKFVTCCVFLFLFYQQLFKVYVSKSMFELGKSILFPHN